MNSLTCLAVLSVVLAASSASTIEKRAAGCTADGKSYASGSSFKSPPDSCFTYSCNDGHPKFVSGACKDQSGQCRNPGTKWDVQCATYTCEQTDTSEGISFGTNIVSFGCKDQSGQCRNPGSKWDVKCTTYTCEQTNTSEGISLAVNIDTVGCQDADGNCRKPGDTFPRTIGGKRYNKCGCTVTGNSVSYSCRG